DEGRKFYGEQPAVQALRKVFDNPFHSIDDYLAPRDEFVQRARDGSTTTYALLVNGEWVARGEVGWFGVAHDQVSKEDWSRKVNEMLDELPDDTLITIVDCHI